jgi:SagB-type dehydrogenase family enzyme
MGGFAILHLVLNWERLIGYGRFRARQLSAAIVRRHAPERSAALAPSGGAAHSDAARSSARPDHTESVRPSDIVGRIALSRRGLIGLTVGGLGGWALGRGLRPAPPIPAGSDVGVIYHEWSKPGIIDALGTVANWGQQPEPYKVYPGATVVLLPEPILDGGLSAAATIANRRSVRAYADRPMTVAELSRFLFLTSGVSADRFGNARRTAPSSGALYPIEIYPIVHNVEGIEPGVYHYAYREHALELVKPGDVRAHVVEQGLGQEFLGQCGAVLFVTQILQRMRPRYQDRSYRYGLLEAGHVGENGYLAATSMGLGACGVGAFMDDQMNALLGVDGTEEAVVYMLAVGHVAAA